MSFLRSMWKNSSKHKKLCEELALANNIKDFSENHEDLDETSDEAISYAVKYIGNTPVESSRSEETTSAAVKNIILSAKSNKKLQRVSLSISPKGIEVSDAVTSETFLQVSIYRISYCSADASHSHVFAFIESTPKLNANKSEDDSEEEQKNAFTGNEDIEGPLVCHAFLCQKRKMAQTVTLTVARSFERAYQIWQNQQWLNARRKKINEENALRQNSSSKPMEEDVKSLLIDFNTELASFKNDSKQYLQNTWISFEDDTADEFHQLAARNLSIMSQTSWDKNSLLVN